MYSPSGKNSEFLRVLISFVFFCVLSFVVQFYLVLFVNSCLKEKHLVHPILFSFYKVQLLFCVFFVFVRFTYLSFLDFLYILYKPWKSILDFFFVFYYFFISVSAFSNVFVCFFLSQILTWICDMKSPSEKNSFVNNCVCFLAQVLGSFVLKI